MSCSIRSIGLRIQGRSVAGGAYPVLQSHQARPEVDASIRAIAPSLSTEASLGRSAVLCCAEATNVTFATAPTIDIFADERLVDLPASSGVYAVFDEGETLQYIGISRNISLTVANHVKSVPGQVHSLRLRTIPNATKDQLTSLWKTWVQEAVNETGSVPPGILALVDRTCEGLDPSVGYKSVGSCY
jgi:hypothetical protein